MLFYCYIILLFSSSFSLLFFQLFFTLSSPPFSFYPVEVKLHPEVRVYFILFFFLLSSFLLTSFLSLPSSFHPAEVQ